jgi:transmembrane sensor
MRWPFVSRRERLRREAADWVARLNGPHDKEDRAAFQRWYDSSPDRARSYDRVSTLFQAAGRLTRPQGVAPSASTDRLPRRPLRYALAAAAACVALLAFLLLSARTTAPLPGTSQQLATFSTERGESRRIVLADGSEVILSGGSVLEVSLARNERRLRLTRGEGRFSVAQEPRPFIVEASGTEVVARGTLFVVRLSDDRTTVSLIEGEVDVSYRPAQAGPDRRRVTRLGPGEQLVVQRTASPGPTPAVDPAPAPPRPAMLQFDDTPLRQAVERMNSHGRPRIRLDGPGVADLRVTGAFRAEDTTGFAESVAAAFDLDLARGPGSNLRLRLRPETSRPH